MIYITTCQSNKIIKEIKEKYSKMKENKNHLKIFIVKKGD